MLLPERNTINKHSNHMPKLKWRTMKTWNDVGAGFTRKDGLALCNSAALYDLILWFLSVQLSWWLWVPPFGVWSNRFSSLRKTSSCDSQSNAEISDRKALRPYTRAQYWKLLGYERACVDLKAAWRSGCNKSLQLTPGMLLGSARGSPNSIQWTLMRRGNWAQCYMAIKADSGNFNTWNDCTIKSSYFL